MEFKTEYEEEGAITNIYKELKVVKLELLVNYNLYSKLTYIYIYR